MTLGEAYDALTKARADYARAAREISRDGGDERAREIQQQAVQKGRAAWVRYQQVAAVGLAERIRGVIPDVFLDKSPIGKTGDGP